MYGEATTNGLDTSFRLARTTYLIRASLLCALILFAALSAALFVWPPSGRLTHADAVLSLNGNDERVRAETALSLVDKGYAPVLLFSVGHEGTPCPTAGRVTVICFVPHPNRTVGEMRFAAHYARAHHLGRILIVAGHEQAVRAGMLARRCLPVPVEVVPAPVSWSEVPFQVIYEWGALGKAIVVARGCGNS